MIVETEQLSKQSLILANHLFPVRLLPAILEFNQKYPTTTYLVDASFEPILHALGLNEIVKIDTRNKHKHLNLPADKTKAQLTSILGYAFNAFKGSLKGEALVKEMVNRYKNGQNLFMFPACVSNPNAEWKVLTGYLALEIPNAHLGFLYIPNSYNGVTRLLQGPIIGSLINPSQPNTPEDLTLAIRSKYLVNR